MLIVKIKKLFNYLFHSYYLKSYSQEGEDIFLRKIFNKKKGFYIDVGCYHPERFSNTKVFYDMGWRGINIDASETNLAAFNKKRPKDINIFAAISDKVSDETFYSFNEGALNTLRNNYSEIEKIRNYKLKKKTKVQTSTLEMILNTHNVKEIDFLDIDIEGYDYKCLIGLNIKKFKPKVILIELRTMEENERKSTKQFLEINNYKLFVSGINTSIYIYNDYLENNSLIQ